MINNFKCLRRNIDAELELLCELAALYVHEDRQVPQEVAQLLGAITIRRKNFNILEKAYRRGYLTKKIVRQFTEQTSKAHAIINHSLEVLKNETTGTYS